MSDDVVAPEQLTRDLSNLGIESGSTLLVHSSLRAIGFVPGGAATLVRALIETVGDDGTLVMPAATPQCGDPGSWSVDRSEDWLDRVRESLPPFDLATTPTTLGAVPETFRNWPGTLRSHHPLESVCARGPLAGPILADHSLEFSEGPGGPFGKLFEFDAHVLLLGVGFNRCTALHYAETLSSSRRMTVVSFPVVEGERRFWQQVPNVADDNDTHFPIVGREYVKERAPTQMRIGNAFSTLFRMRDLVEFAVSYFDRSL